MIKKLVLTSALIICMAALTGCNTLQGFGKDVKSLGEKIEEASE